MSLRIFYENLFLMNGITRCELSNMPEIEFQRTLNYLLAYQPEELFKPLLINTQYRYVSPKLLSHRNRCNRHSRREPMFSNQKESEFTYTTHQNYFQYQKCDEEITFQEAIKSSLQDKISQNPEIPPREDIHVTINQKYDDNQNKEPNTPLSSQKTSQRKLKPKIKPPKVKISQIIEPEPQDSNNNDLNIDQKSKILVTFKFDQYNDIDYSSFKQEILLDTTIKEIKQMISNKFKITDTIEILYKDLKDFVNIDNDMKLEDIIDEIKGKTKRDEAENFLYIRILVKQTFCDISQTIRPLRPNSLTITDDDKTKKKKNKKISYKPKVNPIEKSPSSSATNVISQINEKEDIVKTDEDSVFVRYYYQTNKSDDIFNINMKKDSNVKDLKQEIAKLNDTKAANIKILFAGKDLLDDIILDSLEVVDAKLYAYIKSEDDILLLTARALKVDSEYEYEYEYEYD